MAKRNAEQDAKTIKSLATKGYTEEEITQKLGLTHWQITYSITRWLSPQMVKKVQQQLRDNKERKAIEPIQTAEVQTQPSQAIMLDTSIINVNGITAKLRDVENAVFVFPTIVIEELERMTKKAGFRGYNAREFLNIALKDTNVVIPTADVSALTGWSDSNKDSLIVQTALDIKDQYDVTIYSCDKVLIIKAKSLGLKHVYYKSEPVPTAHDQSRPFVPATLVKNETQDQPLFRKVDEVGEVETLEFAKQGNFHYV